MITAGVDVGSLTGKSVILKDNEIIVWDIVLTGPDSTQTANETMNNALNKAGLKIDDIDGIVSTGYGRVVVPFAMKAVTEISCHAKGANWFFPEVRTILDMGGQDCKGISCNENGKVTKFVMNDKCAAGTGRSMDIMTKILDVPLEKIGELSFQNNKVEEVNNMCVVYAKSEVVQLLRNNVPVNDIIAGLCEATATRVSQLMKGIDLVPEFCITGGIAKNIGIARRIEEKIGMKANICFEPQIVGALGAAIFARERLEKKEIKTKRKEK
jgi:predicted CoA-substrate-specific enzyme activase